jgi:hypothetical protein
MWRFKCKLGLRQDDCGMYKLDKTSRGYGRWGGCPSCKYRVPADADTASAEEEYAGATSLPEGIEEE